MATGEGTGTTVGVISLDCTVGETTSNSYVCTAEASTIIARNLHITDTWAALSLADREASLMYATELLDSNIDWQGTIYTTTQALRWPREGLYDAENVLIPVTSIPQWLQYATSFFGYSLSQIDRTIERDTVGFKNVYAGGINTTPDKYDRYQTIPAHILEMIAPYGLSKIRVGTRLVRY